MAITAGELSIILSAKNEMSKVLKDAQGDMAETQKAGVNLGKMLGGALAGGAVLAVGATVAVGKALYDAGQAAAAEEVGIAKLGAAVKATGADWGTASAAIETYLTKELARTALDDGEGREAISRLTTITGDYSKSLGLMGLAQDLAAAKGIDLSSAAEIVGRVSAGNTGILSRYGIVLKEGATAQEALAQMQKQFGGQAEAYGNTYAGAQQKMQVAMGNLKETIGGAVLPIMTALATKLSELAVKALPILEQGIAKIGPVFDTVMGVLRDQVFPVLADLWDWFVDWLPGAISTYGGYLDNVLMPVLRFLWSFLTDTLIPSFRLVAAWLGEHLPGAIQTLKGFWENTLLPAIKAVWAFIQDPFIPTMSDVVKWLSDNIPKAIETLKGFWENTLLPAIKAVWAFIQDPLIPIFEKVVGWLQDNIPTAISTLAGFWENTLKTAIETVWKFINDPLIPLFEKLWDWLETTIPAAIQTLTDFWTNTLLPAITDVWKFINDPLMPLFKTLADFFDAAFTLAVTAMAGLWQNVLEPAIKGVWKVIDEKVMPVLRDVAEFLGGKLSDAFNTIKDKVLGPAQEKFEKVGGAIGGISGAIDGVIGWLGTMADKLSNIHLPDWLTPGSPTPFEIGLLGIADALQQVVPWMRGLDKAIPDSADLGDSASGFAKLAQSIASLVGSFSGILTGIPGMHKGAAGVKSLFGGNNLDELLGEYFSLELIPLLKELHRVFKYELPKLLDESFTASMEMWARRLKAIADILNLDFLDGVIAFRRAAKRIKASMGGQNLDELLGEYLSLELVPALKEIHRVFKYELPKLMDSSFTESMEMWSKRLGSIASILNLDFIDGIIEFRKAGKRLKTEMGGTNLDELIGEYISLELIPVLKALHRAFKYELPKLLDESINKSMQLWANRMSSIAGILEDAVKASQLVFDAAKGFTKWAGWGLENIRDAIVEQILPVVRGIHAAFKNLPLLSDTEVIAESLEIWAKRYAAIGGILQSAVGASASVFDAAEGFKKWAGWGLETIRDAIVEQLFPVIRGIHAAFKNLPILSETEVISESLEIWAKRYGSIAGILGSAVSASAAVFEAATGFSKWAGWTIENIRDAIIEQIMPVIRGIHAAMKTLPTLVPEETISASMEIWSKRMGAALGIIQSTINIAALDLKNYRAPDLVVIRKLAQDAQDVVEEVSGVASSMYTTAEEMAPKVAMLETVSGMVGKVKSILTDTIDVAKGLSEMSWREVKQNQVDSFTRNLANIVNWLTDSESGITAIANLSGLTAYESAVNALGRIITEVVEAVREVMTLPAVWDNRLMAISSGMAKFFADIATAVTTHGQTVYLAMLNMGADAASAFEVGFAGMTMQNIWSSIVSGASAVLNDGVFRQLGQRNAMAYKAGWAAAGVPYPGGNSQTTNNSYTLNVQTTQPAVNVVSSFGMLEAMA